MGPPGQESRPWNRIQEAPKVKARIFQLSDAERAKSVQHIDVLKNADKSRMNISVYLKIKFETYPLDFSGGN